MSKRIPKKLQGILWSQLKESLDIDKNRNYIIHQIFSHGRMEELRWIFRTYAQSTIQEVFTKHPYKEYDNARFHFIKNYLLDLKGQTLNERLYVKNTPRDIR